MVGSLYKQSIPLANPSRKPGEWQSYDVVWTAPRFNDDGSLKTPAYATVFFNGVLVENHFELKGQTLYIGKPFYKATRRRRSSCRRTATRANPSASGISGFGSFLRNKWLHRWVPIQAVLRLEWDSTALGLAVPAPDFSPGSGFSNPRERPDTN